MSARVRWSIVGVLVAVIAAGAGLLAGLALDDDGSGRTGRSTSDCPIVQVPVSDHVEAMCLPEAAPLVEIFDEPSTPPGPNVEGWSFIGELWLSEDNPYMDIEGKGLCWVNAVDETRCSSP